MSARYLLDRDLTEQDMAQMAYWRAVEAAEVQRIANVLAYWRREVRTE